MKKVVASNASVGVTSIREADSVEKEESEGDLDRAMIPSTGEMDLSKPTVIVAELGRISPQEASYISNTEQQEKEQRLLDESCRDRHHNSTGLRNIGDIDPEAKTISQKEMEVNIAS